MPNHTWNQLTVTGPAADVEAFRVKVDHRTNPELDKPIKIDKEWLDFNGTVPMPKELKDTVSGSMTEKQKAAQEELKLKFGYGNWYDFQKAMWGVKWGAYDQSKPKRIKDGLVYEFNTAWSTPSQWVETTAKIFPTLTFEVEYKDEDDDYGSSNSYEASYKDAYDMTHQKLYKNFLRDITSSEFDKDCKYRDFDKDVLERIKDEDLPLLINFSWDNKELYNLRLTKTTTKG